MMMEKKTPLQAAPSPALYRVSLFGRFTLERLITSSAKDAPRYEPIAERLWRSRSAARSLFKLLLCRTRRRAPKEFLIETLWPDAEEDKANHCFDSAISVLRTLLRPEKQRESLLTTIHTGNTLLYELPPQSLLWVDCDAFTSLLSDAERAKSQGRDPLLILETAQQLVTGEFLEDEWYSEWAQSKRDTMNATRHHLLHTLADLYTQRGMVEHTELLLLTALEHENTDEDALCRLMLLLHQQGRRHEALRFYQRTVDALHDELATQPSAYTQGLATQIREEPVMLEKSYPAITRREALVTLAGLVSLPLTDFSQHPSFFQQKVGDLLSQCATTLTECWHAMKGDGLASTEQVLPAYLSLLGSLVQQPSKQQAHTAALLSRANQLASLVALHHNNLIAREQYNHSAVTYAILSGDHDLLVAALMRLAYTYHSQKQPQKALAVYQQSLPLLPHISPFLHGRIYVGLANAYAQCGKRQEAERALGLLHEHPLPVNQKIDDILYVDFGHPLRILYEGTTRLALKQPETAWNALSRIETLQSGVVVPERIRLEIVNQQAAVALALKDQERFTASLREGIMGAHAIKSEKRHQEAHDIYTQAQMLWPHEARLRELKEVFVQK